MKKILVLVLVLMCSLFNPQIVAIPDTSSGVVHYTLSSSTPIVFATGSNTPAKTPASSGDAPASATPAAEKDLVPLYPAKGDAATTATADCSVVNEPGGLIPCGRYTNSSDTAWNECDPCDFCAIPLAIQLVTDYLLKLVGVVTLVAIILGQLIAMTAIGQTDTMVKIKSVLGSALMGFGYVFAAWVLVNSILAFIGYTDPLSGQWFTVC